MLQDPGQGQVGHGDAGLSGEFLHLLDQLQLALVAGNAHIESSGDAGTRGPRTLGSGVLLAIFTRQPAPVQRAPGQDTHAVSLRRRQDIGLDAACADRVRRRLADEAREVPPLRCPLGFDDVFGGINGAAGVADLPLVDEVAEGTQGFLDVGSVVWAMDLVEVDPVGAEAAKAVLDLDRDPATGVAAPVDVVAHAAVELGRQDDVIPAPLEGSTDNLLRLAVAVDVGGIDKVDAGVEGGVDDPDAVIVVGVAPGAEHHGTEAAGADTDAGPTQAYVFHGLIGSRTTTGISALGFDDRDLPDVRQVPTVHRPRVPSSGAPTPGVAFTPGIDGVSSVRRRPRKDAGADLAVRTMV